MKKMALDLGNVRIGIATSDMLNIIATGLETYTRKSLKEDLIYIANLIKKHNVDTVIIGLPINMDGSHGDRVDVTKTFGEALKNHTTANIIYQDERLTSLEAEEILIGQNMSREKRKKVIDQLAAAIILQSYIDRF
ncbi:MAG: Holliday junction resolvase RuvX [Tenericutes bacterium HGW-Tenericutes-4]|jgi:putative Holliday junction resolvase|nr:MAG: Holliday junction resolvase RuvX [Tenericutes bacterium HGW-Tenericutes-4]